MPKVALCDAKRAEIGQVELPDSIFAAPVKQHLVHEVVVNQLASRRQGTHAAKGRGDVNYTGKKPFRQKGTGNARQGSFRSPLRRGGGAAHGPHPRDYSYRINRKVRSAALRSALSHMLAEGKITVVKDLGLAEIKSKIAAATLKGFGVSVYEQSALIVIGPEDKTVALSCRNLPFVKVIQAAGLNVYDALRFDQIILTEEALAIVNERLA